MGNPVETPTTPVPTILSGSKLDVDSTASSSTAPSTSLAEVAQKYQQERAKRLRPDGASQFAELTTLENCKYSSSDPWIEFDKKNGDRKNGIFDASSNTPKNCKYLIVGAGFGGLIYAAKLIQAGINVKDIWMVDSAGGYGGTWYWNRYPGLMCDVESYIYMPLLEEMEHIPKHKYAYGPELREYAEKFADKFRLRKNTLFSTVTQSMTWDDKRKEWVLQMSRQQTNQSKPQFTVRSQYVFLTCGILSIPKVPRIPGLENFKGHSFHTSRWDYAYTGGSPEDQTLTNLRDKRVGIIGTGATAIQVIPELAKWAKELYVFQRTPSAVDIRGQRATDPDCWKREVANKKGWQRERTDNFSALMHKVTPAPAVDLVDDQWTKGCYHALIGTPRTLLPEEVPTYVASLHAMDLPNQERIRARVDEIVKDRATAEALKPWYNSWCKRPCFHDDYLPAFNLPNVKLIDTDGKGIERVTENAVVVAGQEYEVDVLIFSTGYNSPGGNPEARSGMSITGRSKTLSEKWDNTPDTLHGITTQGFPNLFLSGPSQTGAVSNYTAVLDQLATHTAYIVSSAEAKASKKRQRATVEPTVEAEGNWSMQIMQRAGCFGAVAGCTPSYLNKEGEADRPKTMEEMMKAAKGAPWGHGLLDYTRVLEGWRAQGDLEGLEVSISTTKAKSAFRLLRDLLRWKNQ